MMTPEEIGKASYRYSIEHPDGKLFHQHELASLGNEWKDNPALLDSVEEVAKKRGRPKNVKPDDDT